jgi:hypothetical protein
MGNSIIAHLNREEDAGKKETPLHSMALPLSKKKEETKAGTISRMELKLLL